MGARKKLNTAYFASCLVVAGLFGAVTTSWGVFAAALLLCLAACRYAGAIRPGR